MKEKNLQLIVPEPLHPTFTRAQQEWLFTFSDFRTGGQKNSEENWPGMLKANVLRCENGACIYIMIFQRESILLAREITDSLVDDEYRILAQLSS